ncbi:MAG TPA: hypothetical protein VH934_12325 [Xanthobacteraceae bacterium]|jgi:hypothetical protein
MTVERGIGTPAVLPALGQDNACTEEKAMKRGAKKLPAGPSRDSMRAAPSREDDASHQPNDSDDDVCSDNELGAEWTGNLDCYDGPKNEYIDDLRIDPPLVVKRRLDSLAEARAFVEDEMRLGRSPAWREMHRRLATVRSEDEACQAIGALRKLLELEDLLVPPSCP